MNDRYLFRGKRVNADQWEFGSLVYCENYEGEKTFIATDILDVKNTMQVREKTVGQYTGLTDKNGVKIFEGDVLGEKGHYFTVVYDAKWAKFKLQHGKVYQYPEWNRGVLMEVIGNIHDNPELLEGKA